MAGRILPVAFAVISGISIGVATWDGELKEQRRQRLQKEYERDVAAVSALNSEGPSPMASSSINPPAPAQLPTAENANSSILSRYLGFWAWKSPNTPTNADAQSQSPDQQQKP